MKDVYSKNPKTRMVELEDSVRESEEIRERLRTERDDLKKIIDALCQQISETLRNKAMLEAQLRCRIAGIDVTIKEEK